MSTLPDGSTQQTRRRQAYQDEHAGSADRKQRPEALATSLESISVQPRTPKTPRPHWSGDDGPMDEVELSLLDKGELPQDEGDVKDKQPLSTRDRRAIVLLIILYLIQGFPLGLALGSIPFLLREHLSYSQLATFSLASYPYSLKLFWSPIVDAVYTPALGRRKSWIIPMQLLVGSIMTILSFYADEMMKNPSEYIYVLTAAFTTLVLLSATQDIAVDGWALTLLSEENLSYASTCQTIGLNTGYLLSYTVFLALNSEAFAEKWGFRRLELSTYLLFCSMISFGTTIWLFFEQEDEEEEMDMSIRSVYKTMWTICSLKHVQTLLTVHLFAKIAFQAHDAVTSLKMVEKGLGREDLAVAVLIDFPFSILGGWLAGRWSRGDRPLDAWINSYWPRLALTFIATLMVYWFPKPPISTPFFIFIIVETVAASFASTIQFGGMAAFHTRVSDPVVGGTYMTLFATFSNLGGTWPRYFVLKGVDFFSVATCQIGTDLAVEAAECVSEHGKAACAAIGGECVTERDGYNTVSAICLGLGLLSVIFYMIPTARRLQAIPPSRWRVFQ